jgi:TPR repeat protein
VAGRGKVAAFWRTRWRHAVLRLAAAACVLAAIVWPTAAAAENRVALIIGNGSYASSRLNNPRSDAGLMARTLASTGFDVMTVMDATAEEMRQAISDFGTRLQTPGTVALFYYAGHGVQVDGDNYLIPLGAGIHSTEDVTEYGVALQSVMRTMERSGSRLNIVVLDACRDNPFSAGAWSASINGLASVVAPADTIIAYATGPGQLADDGAGSNSPYTAALASEIVQPGATLEDVFRATRRHVLERTGNHQTPWEHSSLVSQFYFVPKPAVTTSAIDASTDRDARFAEVTAWDAIKTTHDRGILRAHLAQFPNGLFSELAAVRLAKLEAIDAQRPWPAAISGTSGEQVAAAIVIYDKALKLDGDAATASDMATAVKLYLEAAAEGLPSAMYRLGRSFDKGRGVSKDLLQASRWYERAADSNYAPAMAALGTMHEFGEGAAPNLAEALRLYRGASDAGDPSGMTSLAYLYSQGKGVSRNTSEARRLYQAAADKRFPRAMFNLALMDMTGEGGRTDRARARKLFEAAAALGHSGATIELARIYDRGLGTGRDTTRAAQYLLKAVQASHKEGRKIDVASLGLTFATRRQIQKQLAAQGLYGGIFHGFFNEETRKALVAVAER